VARTSVFTVRRGRRAANLAPVSEREGRGAERRLEGERGGSLGRVLVVDDDEVIRQLIAVNLQLEGFEVEMATDGQDCLDKVRDVNPDVITLDIMMPRLDGWVTAVRLREDQATRHIKVVMITARAQEHDIQRGREIGVDAYVTKPFDPAELIRTVRSLALG
jgi:DNA-binding response OmpR family regulator